MQIMSQAHSVVNLTINDYLKQVHQYLSTCFKVDHPVIDANMFWVVSRIMLSPNAEVDDPVIGESKFKLSIKYPIKYIKLGVKMYLHYSSSRKKREINFDEFFTLNEEEAKEVYHITLSIKSEFRIKEGSFEIEILYDNKNIRFEIVEHVDPYVVIDKYTPNKSKCLFSEYLYPSEKISCSLRVKLRHVMIEESQKQIEAKREKGKANDQLMTAPVSYAEGKELRHKTRLILELYHLTKEPSLEFIYDSVRNSYSNKGELVCSWDFYNEITITHLNLEGDVIEQSAKKKVVSSKKKEVKEALVNQLQSSVQSFPYLLVCYFSNEVNEEIFSKASGDLGWCIEVFSSDMIGFVRDTSKEEHESKLKEGWEENEGGRAVLSLRSRQKYLIFERKKKGGVLQKEEEELLNEERERKFSSSANEETQKDLKSQIPLPKKLKVTHSKEKKITLKKPALTDRDRSMLERSTQEGDGNKSLSMKTILDYQIPKLSFSKSDFVAKYVQYAKKDRTFIRSYRNHAAVADSEYRDKAKLSILHDYENSEQLYKNNSMVSFLNKPSDFNDSLSSFSKSLSAIRMSKKHKHEVLFSNRTNIQQESQKKFEIKNKVKEILREGSQKSCDFNSCMAIYQEAKSIYSNDHPLVKKLSRVFHSKRRRALRMT